MRFTKKYLNEQNFEKKVILWTSLRLTDSISIALISFEQNIIGFSIR